MRFEGKVQNGVSVLENGHQLAEGTRVEVIVRETPEMKPVAGRRSMLEFLAALPPGPLLFQKPGDADRYLREERDTWER